MILVISPSFSPIEIANSSPTSLVIENKKYFYSVVSDIYNQSSGCKGDITVTDNYKILDLSKNIDLLTDFVPFDINRKTLITKITNKVELVSQSPPYTEKTIALLTDIEKYLDELSFDFPCDLCYNKLHISAIIKSVGIEIADDSENLAEQLINYMSLVREFDKDKLFVTVNLRCFIDDNTMNLFLDSVIAHKFLLLMIESVSFQKLQNEIRYTIDDDLCEF